MSTAARVGIDILALDKTRAAFASAAGNMSMLGKSAGILKGALAGAFAGFAAGGFVQSMIRGFVDVNKHVGTVKASFTMVDRAWQQFALNVGRSGLNDAIVRFNTAMSATMVNGKGLAEILGRGLGAAIDGLANVMVGAGRAVEFLSDNIAKLDGWWQKISKTFSLGKTGLFDFSDDIRILNALGLDTSAFTGKTGDMKKALASLPPTFAEVEAATKKAESAQKKLREAYRGGIQGLQDYANGLLLQEQTFGMSEGAAARYTKKFEFLNQMHREGVVLTAAQRKEMTGWLDVILRSSAALDQQKASFQKLEDTKKSMADLFQSIGQAVGGAVGGAFESIIDGTASVSKAFKQMGLNILKSVTALFANRMFTQLMGGYTPGSNGVAGTGTGLIGGLISKIFGGFGGFKAGGGPVQAGKAYVVGERRPEVFVPSTSGTIIPQVPMGGSSGVNVVVNNYAGAEVKATQRPDGKVQIDLRRTLSDIVSGGGLDKALGGRFGMRPAGRTI